MKITIPTDTHKHWEWNSVFIHFIGLGIVSDKLATVIQRFSCRLATNSEKNVEDHPYRYTFWSLPLPFQSSHFPNVFSVEWLSERPKIQKSSVWIFILFVWHINLRLKQPTTSVAKHELKLNAVAIHQNHVFLEGGHLSVQEFYLLVIKCKWRRSLEIELSLPPRRRPSWASRKCGWTYHPYLLFRPKRWRHWRRLKRL